MAVGRPAPLEREQRPFDPAVHRHRHHDGLARRPRHTPLLAARRKPVGSFPRRGILSSHWDRGNVVGAFRGRTRELYRARRNCA